MGDGLERKETRGMKPTQEAALSEPSLLSSLLMYVEDIGPVSITLDQVMVNTGFLSPSVTWSVVQSLVGLGTVGGCVKQQSLEPVCALLPRESSLESLSPCHL